MCTRRRAFREWRCLGTPNMGNVFPLARQACSPSTIPYLLLAPTFINSITKDTTIPRSGTQHTMPGPGATTQNLIGDPYWEMVHDYVDDEHIITHFLRQQSATIMDPPSEFEVPSLTTSPSSMNTDTNTIERSNAQHVSKHRLCS